MYKNGLYKAQLTTQVINLSITDNIESTKNKLSINFLRYMKEKLDIFLSVFA